MYARTPRPSTEKLSTRPVDGPTAGGWAAMTLPQLGAMTTAGTAAPVTGGGGAPGDLAVRPAAKAALASTAAHMTKATVA
jgi:hypothetical protein